MELFWNRLTQLSTFCFSLSAVARESILAAACIWAVWTSMNLLKTWALAELVSAAGTAFWETGMGFSTSFTTSFTTSLMMVLGSWEPLMMSMIRWSGSRASSMDFCFWGRWKDFMLTV